VTIALDAAWERLENGLAVDPKQLLEEMRNQRGCLIQAIGINLHLTKRKHFIYKM
jgi:hypothetical protein